MYGEKYDDQVGNDYSGDTALDRRGCGLACHSGREDYLSCGRSELVALGRGGRQLEQVDYKKEISRIEGRHFDVAFVPLDPRLEESYALGMLTFLEHTDTDVVFPMHMWDRYEIISRLKADSKGKQYRERIMDVRQPGQEFIV